MSSEINSAEQLYQAAIANFEHGNYQDSVHQLEQAIELIDRGTKLGGEMQVWLVNAYDAVGRSTEAIALCRSLTKHPNIDVRKLAKYVLGILSAPKLRDLQGVVSEIPSFSTWGANSRQSNAPFGKRGSSSASAENTTNFNGIDIEDKSRLPTSNSNMQFLWVMIALSIITLTIWSMQ